MSDTADTSRRFRVRAGHEDAHHGRVLAAPTVEAAALAYVEHLPLRADQLPEIAILVRDLDTGHEHSFRIHVEGPDAIPSV